MPFVSWYLQQMNAYEQQNGRRILDYLDLHYYPQAGGVALSSEGGASTQALRLRSTRSLWDASYIDESWISDTAPGGEAVRLIPRMRDWVNSYYPGTKLAITEYNWGGLESINGALAQADALGIFGREGLDMATLWAPPSSIQPGPLPSAYTGIMTAQDMASAISAWSGKLRAKRACRLCSSAQLRQCADRSGN